MNRFTDAQIYQKIFKFMRDNYKFKRVLIDSSKDQGIKTIHRLRKFVYLNGALQESKQNTFAQTYTEIEDMFSHCKSEVTLFLGC